MEQELRQLNTRYQSQIGRLNVHKNQLIQQVNRMTLQRRYKSYYLKQIEDWYNRTKQQLDEQYNKLANEIREKYKPQIVQDQIIETSIGNKKACLIGINYTNTENELQGCVNDVMKLKGILESKYKYNPENIKTVINENATRANILQEFIRLLKESTNGDTLFFSFSGHGSSMADRNNDEIDGKDELIVSVDYYAIFDDELKQIIDAYLKPNVKLFTLFDSCHSGTMLDLPYQYFKNNNSSNSSNNNDPLINPKCKETKGEVICLSGCRDDQTSMDAYINKAYNGAMTWALVNVLSNEKSISRLDWKSFVDKIRSTLQTRNFDQVPQLTCGLKTDFTTKLVEL